MVGFTHINVLFLNFLYILMEYNSSRNQIEMREYGRYIQKLVDFAMTKTDRKERLRVCENIIDIMGM